MSQTIQGKLKAVGKINKVGANETHIRKFWLDITNNGYENFAEFQLMNEKCSLVDEIKEGQQIEVYYNINGRTVTYTDKLTGEAKKNFFQNLQAWRIVVLEKHTAGIPAPKPESFSLANDEEDLPF